MIKEMRVKTAHSILNRAQKALQVSQGDCDFFSRLVKQLNKSDFDTLVKKATESGNKNPKIFLRIVKQLAKLGSNNPRVIAISDQTGKFHRPNKAAYNIGARLYAQYLRKSTKAVSRALMNRASVILRTCPF